MNRKQRRANAAMAPKSVTVGLKADGTPILGVSRSITGSNRSRPIVRYKGREGGVINEATKLLSRLGIEL